jgi:hypothetical protein
MSWKRLIDRAKPTDKQSLEGFFLNADGTLFAKLFQKRAKNQARFFWQKFERLKPLWL